MSACCLLYLFVGMAVFGAGAVVGAGADGGELKVIAQPQLAQQNSNGSVAVMCTTALPVHLDACQLWVHGETENSTSLPPHVDLVPGAAATPVLASGGGTLFLAVYHGGEGGLGQGRCGANLTLLAPGRYVLGCRVRRRSAAIWAEDFMALVVHTKSISQTREVPKTGDAGFEQHVARVGTDIQVPFPVGAPVFECKFYLPHQMHPIVLSPSMPTVTTSNYKAAILASECRVTLLGVRTESNGLVWCLSRANAASDFRMFAPVVIVVVGPPPAVQLNVTPAAFAAGAELTATCHAGPSHPRARLAWDLAGRRVRSTDLDDLAVDTVGPWPWIERPAMQVLRRTLTEEDLDKNLTCRVTHPAFDPPGNTRDFNLVIHRDLSVCSGGFLACHWRLVLFISLASIFLFIVFYWICVHRRRRDWRWS